MVKPQKSRHEKNTRDHAASWSFLVIKTDVPLNNDLSLLRILDMMVLESFCL
jgi:hypothetical protein